MKNTIKLFGLLALALVCTGFVFTQGQTEEDTFAQEQSEESTETTSVADDSLARIRANAITLDLFPLFKGFIASDNNTDSLFIGISAAYERLIFPHFSIGVDFEIIPDTLHDTNYINFGVAAAGRCYPMSEYMEKLFLAVHLGFNMQLVDGKFKAEDGGFIGMFAGLRAGCKLHFTELFFVEPSIAYTYSKTSFDLLGMTPNNYGWQAGLRVGVSF